GGGNMPLAIFVTGPTGRPWHSAQCCTYNRAPAVRLPSSACTGAGFGGSLANFACNARDVSRSSKGNSESNADTGALPDSRQTYTPAGISTNPRIRPHTKWITLQPLSG